MYNAHVRTGDVTPELAPVEPAEENWTRHAEMDVGDGDHDEQNEAVQPEELTRVHRRQTVKELEKQEQGGPRIYSDFFCMSEAGVATPMLALRFSRAGRVAATALEQRA